MLAFRFDVCAFIKTNGTLLQSDFTLELPSAVREQETNLFGIGIEPSLAMEIPGIQTSTAQTLASKLGPDISRWKTETHFTFLGFTQHRLWSGLFPDATITGGDSLSKHTWHVVDRANTPRHSVEDRHHHSSPGLLTRAIIP